MVCLICKCEVKFKELNDIVAFYTEPNVYTEPNGPIGLPNQHDGATPGAVRLLYYPQLEHGPNFCLN